MTNRLRMEGEAGSIDCAIILAAGHHQRMGPIECPKALLSLHPSSSDLQPPTTFFSRHVEMLARKGIRRIFVVTRKGSENAFLFDNSSPVPVEVVISRFSEFRVGSSLSLLCGLEAAQAWGGVNIGVLVMDADIIYERALLDAVTLECDRSRLFTIDRVAGDAEEVRVYGHSVDRPVLIGKGLSSMLTADLALLGESLGIIYLAPAEVSYCSVLIRWLAGEPPNLSGFGFAGVTSEHEEVWQYLFNLNRLGIGRLPGSLVFSECDSPEDYAHIQDSLFPAIVEREHRMTP